MNILRSNTEVGHLVGHKTKVIAKFFYEIMSEDDLRHIPDIFRFARENNLRFLVISGGTNIIFSKNFFDWVIIKNSLFGWDFDKNTKILTANSAEKISDIAKNLESDYNEKIWHRFIGLPGAIAGAVVGNAGCFGLETEGNFVSAKILDMENGEIFQYTKADMNFSYRHSVLKEKRNFFVISTTFNLSEVHEKYHSDVDNIDFRENKQPKWNSCGSFFKNPNRENSAGFLIEAVGLKWKRIGWAYWSDLHANFLLSDGETCAPEDLQKLIELTQKKVKSETGYDLIPEVNII